MQVDFQAEHPERILKTWPFGATKNVKNYYSDKSSYNLLG